MDNILIKAIQAVQQSEIAYCKYLSANDTKSTKAHQAGYLVGKSAWSMFLPQEPVRGSNIKVDMTIKWQNDFETNSTFTYYGASKNEFRLTNFGKNFPFREEENTGDLFILTKVQDGYYLAFILGHDEDIDDFFAAVNISSTETNAIIPRQEVRAEDKLISCFLAYVTSLEVDFPPTIDMALRARDCYNAAYSVTKSKIISNPDKEILGWVDAEFQLFKTIENDRYSTRIQTPFASVEELVNIANTILNRRKSRAGKSLEHHLSEVFTNFNLTYETQAKTEDNKKPDFLFPGAESYFDPTFDQDKLIVLASKTTCKDRWRQILNEADRVKTKYLFTLQQGISKNQLEEMYKYDVCMVVPKPYLTTFPEEFRPRILTLDGFVKQVQATQQ